MKRVNPMIQIRDSKSIYQINGEIANGSFPVRCYFAFGDRTVARS